MNAKVQKITVTEPIENEDGTYTVTVANLDDLVRSFRNKLKDKRYRNLPNPKDKTLRMEVDIFSAQYVKQILYVTQGLIEAQELESDKYGFLTSSITSFEKWNDILNKEWIPMAKEALAKEEAEAKAKESAEIQIENADSPLSEVEVSALACEPTCEADSKTEVKTKKGQRWIFDKVNYTLTYKVKGSDKVINLVPQGTWRSTVLKFLVKTMAWIKKKYNDFKDRCIGIKQTIQFKMMMMKMERQAKAEAKKAEKEMKKAQSSSGEPDLDSLPSFS